YGTLNASLDTGSLAGTQFPVQFSYDADQLPPVGEAFVTLNSFDFTLLGVPFTRDDIFQGGQVTFEDGVLQNVTASFQVFLPPGSPVTNITFGFGEPLGIVYLDLNDDFGSGSFSFKSCTLPDHMAPGDFLLPGQFRQSTDGRFRLIYQGDGNLV